MWVEETKSGKFKFVEQYTDYMTGKKKRASVTLEKNNVAAQRTAMEKLAKLMEVRQKQPSDKTLLTFSELIEKYRIYQQKTVKPATYKRNYFATEALQRILGSDILVERLGANYIKKCFLESGLENSTLNEHRTRLFALLRWGYENDYISDISFLKKIKPFQDISHREKIQDKYLEPMEIDLLLKDMHVEKWQLLTRFLILSGLRIGEATALEVADIDIKNHTIHVCKNYDANNHIVTTPKTIASIRDVYITSELESVCRAMFLHMKKESIHYGFRSQLFLSDKKGNYVNYYSYHKYLKEHSEKVLGRVVTPHALRHTHASLLLAQGIDVDTISRRLGHENSKITKEIYLHITQQLVERDNLQLNSVKIM